MMPSLSEGLPLALVEAMATGLPIVASDVGGIPEVVEGDAEAVLVPAASPPALAAAIGPCSVILPAARRSPPLPNDELIRDFSVRHHGRCVRGSLSGTGHIASAAETMQHPNTRGRRV